MLWNRNLPYYQNLKNLRRVFNKRTKKVEENLHVDFLKNTLIEKGAGPNWLFDIDTLTNSMNYVPMVVAGTSSTNISAHMEYFNNDAQDACNANAPESSRIFNPTATSKILPAKQMESLTVESVIPTVLSQEETVSLDNALTLSNRFEDTIRVEAYLSNMMSSIPASPTPMFRIHKDHPKSQIISLVDTPVQTRHKSKEMEEHSFIATIHQKTTPDLLHFCLFSCFLSQEEPKKIFDALKDSRIRPIGTKWVLKNNKDERGIVIRNKAMLVAQGHTQEEGIDYEEVFAPVVRIEAIRLFLAYASFMGFTVYQMDVKSTFLYGTIDEEVYVMQPPRFQDPEFPNRVYKGKDGPGKDVELHLYRSMIGSLMYLTASRPDIMFAVCHPKLGLWYPKESPFDLLAYSDIDYGGATQDRKSTTGEKTEHNIDFHQIVDFIEASHIRQYSRRATWIAQSKALSPATNEPASLLRDDSQREAFPTVTSLDTGQNRENIIKTSAIPHESTPRVTSLDADEARIMIIEDKDRGRIEPAQEDALIKAGSIEIGEEVEVKRTTELGSNDIKEMVNVLSSMDATNTLTSGVPTVSVSPVATATTVGVPTVSGLFPTVSATFTTASVVKPYLRRPRGILAKDKGKEKVVESEEPKKKKLQEQIDAQVAKEMKEEFVRENQKMNEQLARDGEIARIHAEEELKMLIDGLDKSNEEIKEKFNPVWKQLEDFVPMSSTDEGERMKRKRLKLDQRSAKRMNTSKDVSKEDLKGMMQLVPVEEFDREDLHQLWALVKETLSIKQATKDKEKELWVELKRLFEPDFEDQLWTHYQNLMHDPLEWKLYDTCSVHHVFIKDQEIFMLVERDYPLRREFALLVKIRINLGQRRITLNQRRVLVILGMNNKWYQSLLRSFDQMKNNTKVQQSLLSWPSQRMRPSPSIDSSKSNTSDLQNSNSSVSEHGESSDSIMSMPMIKFVEAADCPKVDKTNKTNIARKSPIKYVEMYRSTSRSPKVRGKSWKKKIFAHKNVTPRAVLLKTGRASIRVNRTNMNVAQQKMTSFAKTAHSNVKRPFQGKSAVRTQFRVPRVSNVTKKFPTVDSKFSTAKSTSTADLGNKRKAVKASACWIWRPKQNTTKKGPNFNGGNSQNNIDDKGYWDSGCSRHMTSNISYLSKYEPYDGGYVSFGQGGSNITGKGISKTGKLKFENVYFVKELKYNLFSVS
uniref:Uncharacterized protein n=1 Tax=Tanacetum cinerariifolium TaxID=118510 RepID=A0A699GTF7_TANCI|nr:hypothetical protein [Tanacetum cinerariifolium]